MKFKKIIASLSAAVVLSSFGTSPAFSTNIEITAPQDEFAAILERINNEYGTNFHAMTKEEKEELENYGLNFDVAPYESSESEMTAAEFEELFRYYAEVKIPEFERSTQEAIAAAKNAETDTNDIFSVGNNASTLAAGTIIATKAIDYAVAGAESSITKDVFGNDVWSGIINGYCYTNMYQDIWFLAPRPSVKHADGRRTLSWTGTGDYWAYKNGTQYYLYSGTQYASMHITNYV